MDIQKAISSLSKRCPSRIEAAEWQDPVLLLSGPEWRLRAICSWRLVSKTRMLVGSDDEDAGSTVLGLRKRHVVDVRLQSEYVPLDLAVEFNDGTALELFSSAATEPWVLAVGDSDIFVASPTSSQK